MQKKVVTFIDIRAIFMTILYISRIYLEIQTYNCLLENVHIISKSAKPHYMVKLNGTSKILKSDWKSHYNVELLEYGPSFDDLEVNIEELHDLVLGERSSRGIG